MLIRWFINYWEYKMLYWWIDGFSNARALFLCPEKTLEELCICSLWQRFKELQQYWLKVILLSIQQPQLCSIKWESSRNKQKMVLKWTTSIFHGHHSQSTSLFYDLIVYEVLNISQAHVFEHERPMIPYFWSYLDAFLINRAVNYLMYWKNQINGNSTEGITKAWCISLHRKWQPTVKKEKKKKKNIKRKKKPLKSVR